MRVVRNNVALYREASVSSEEVGSLNEGDILFLKSSRDRWYNVSIPGKKGSGWVLSFDVELLED